MQKHFVTFYSPGTFFHEETTKEIESWNVEQAVEMSKGISKRYNAKPFGFRFQTIDKFGSDWNVKTETTAESPMYYLGGDILTLKDVKKRNNPNDKTLISNMQNNGWKRIIENRNSWRVTQPLGDNDVVLETPTWAA